MPLVEPNKNAGKTIVIKVIKTTTRVAKNTIQEIILFLFNSNSFSFVAKQKTFLNE